jgi:hypothetical protein
MTKLIDTEKLLLWQETKVYLKLLETGPPASLEEVDNLLAVLPKRQPGESLRQWLVRGKGDKQWIFKPITEIIRLAADTSDSEFPLPDPGLALESTDGQFRLMIVVPETDKITIKIETLGFAADEFANQPIGIASAPREDAVVAVINLNEDGDGDCTVADRMEVRKTLLRPTIGVYERDGTK